MEYNIDDRELYILLIKKQKIQNMFNFKIPDYVLDEMLIKNNKENIETLINIAVMNKRITKKNAKILKDSIDDIKI